MQTCEMINAWTRTVHISRVSQFHMLVAQCLGVWFYNGATRLMYPTSIKTVHWDKKKRRANIKWISLVEGSQVVNAMLKSKQQDNLP